MTPALVQRYLAALVYGAPEQFASALPDNPVALQETADWFRQQRLAAWVYKQLRPTSGKASALSLLLQPAYFNTAMQNRLHFDALAAILRAFQKEQIPATLLKGAALAQAAYGSLEARPMGDVDLWLRAEDMVRAVQILTALGFRQGDEKEARPLALQQLSRGEIQFAHPNWQKGLVELHWSGFPGWWLQRTAVIDDEAIWQRTLPVPLPDLDAATGDVRLLRRLSPEDMVIQLAVHQAVSSQFGTRPVGGLLDLALAVKCWPVDWALLAERAQRRRVGVALWLVLHLTQALIGLPGVETALARLRPAPLRRFLLQRLVNPHSITAAADLRHGRWRYLLLLLLIDRPRDMLRLLYRAVWPEPEWLAARYGSDASRARHIRQMLRFGQF